MSQAHEQASGQSWSKGTRVFCTNGSPLVGRGIPADWRILNLNGKRWALVKVGYAQNYAAACALLGKHAGAVRAAKKKKELYLKQEIESAWWNK